MSMIKGGERQWNIAMMSSLDDWKDFLRNGRGRNMPGVDALLRQLEQPFKDLDVFLEAADRIDEIASNIDLGGALKKSRLKITDNPSGVFDFGLASLGLQRLIEFYSEKLAKEHPTAFEEYDVLAGVVPNVLVDKNEFEQYYVRYNGVKYILEKRQKGTTLILRSNPSTKLVDRAGVLVPENATDREIAQLLGFTSVQKKSYIEFSKKGGVTPYIDLVVPMNWITSGRGLQSLTAVLPAVMAAKFFERAGIGTRIWTGRVVAEERGQVAAPFDYSVAKYVVRDVQQPKNPIGAQPAKPLKAIEDRVVPAFFQVKPIRNRVALIMLKDRNTKADYNAIGHVLATDDGRSAIADTAYRAFARSRNSNIGDISGSDLWYLYPQTMAMVGSVVGKFQNYIAKNNLWGDNAYEGAYVPTEFKPTPEQLVLGTYTVMENYDVEESIKDGTLLLHNHPFGYTFWLIIDRAQLVLGEDESQVISQIFKRLTNEGYDDKQIMDYIAYLSYLAFSLTGEDPLEALEAYVGRPIKAEPTEYYPTNPTIQQWSAKKAKSLIKAYKDMINRRS